MMTILTTFVFDSGANTRRQKHRVVPERLNGTRRSSRETLTVAEVGLSHRLLNDLDDPGVCGCSQEATSPRHPNRLTANVLYVYFTVKWSDTHKNK